ncbi:MAG TPA: ferrous iron transport protein B [Myxococcota bacterium]|nr:ferrous iron transport protein B [Myxococcota bacterium]
MIAPILLLGNQNTGKTTLFNALTGLNAKVANYPGITVEARIGQITRFAGEKVQIVDLPGTYSLIPASDEEELTVKALFGELPDLREHSLVVVVIDCTELRRGLYLYSQLIELGFKTIIALSMIDQRSEAWSRSTIATLQRNLGTLVVPVSASNRRSIERLTTTIDGVLAGSLHPHIKEQPLLSSSLTDDLQQKLSALGPNKNRLPLHVAQSADLIRNHNLFLYNLTKRWRLNKTASDLLHLGLSPNDIRALDRLLPEIPEERFKRVDQWLNGVKTGDSPVRAKSDLIDKLLLQPVIGSLLMLTVFVVMLQSLFLVAQPLASLMSDGIDYIKNSVGSFMPAQSMIRSLIVDGIFEGTGSILSFLPLIALLFLFLGFLEDSGYLARATFLLDSLLKRTGLCGRSLVPMLSGFACAVPAIMAARTIGNRKIRLITILVTPFLTCSARLPVFGLIVGTLFSAYPPIFGIIDVGALMFLSMYALGILASLIAAALLSKILKADGSQSLAIELPPYRWPNPLTMLKRVTDRVYLFVRDVGSVILASTIIIWALFHFEPYSASSAQAPLSNASVPVTKTIHLEDSYAGVIGHSIEPLLKPMGLDWQVGVGIIASLLAREVFVSTMAVVYGLEGSGVDDVSLKQAFKNHVSPLSGFCLLIFFTLSMQCVSTMAVTRRETGSTIWPLLQFVLMTGSGLMLAALAYQLGSFFGFA